MEALSYLINKAVLRGFLLGCRVKGRGGDEAYITNLLIIDDMLVFCEASQDEMASLS